MTVTGMCATQNIEKNEEQHENIEKDKMKWTALYMILKVFKY